MMAMGFSRLLTPFMDEIDAIGYSMQFIPALFGALLIFPVYFLGKELFGKKSGLIAAFFIAIVPIHVGSGHGSAFSLFDHDSFNLLLYMLAFLFLVKALREKDSTKALLYAVLAGIPIAGLSMTWVEAQFIYVVIAAYAIIQMIIDIFTNKINTNIFRTTTVILATGYIVSMPVMFAQYGGFSADLPFFITIAVFGFGFVYYLFGKKNIPWTISLPVIFSVGAAALVFLYFIKDLIAHFPFLAPFEKIAGIIFGTGGIYSNKVSMTIAEANTYQISHTVMSFGPALYWVGWTGLIFACYLYYKQKLRRDLLFVIVMFIVNLWLTGTAGRFLNDMVPWICILAGWVIIIAVNRIDYKQMLRNIKSAGGGLHGIRRGVKFMHVGGILFIAFIVILPNAFVAFDAAIPNTNYEYELDDGTPATLKEAMFGTGHRPAYGLFVSKEKYWGDAFQWLSEQDTDIKNPEDRPAFISWWDYGFYEVALGEHPTVADNFQDGIPPAANFHTSTSEQEAVVVWIVRLLEGDVAKNGGLSDGSKAVLYKYFDDDVVNNITLWIEDSGKAPLYGEPIGKQYDKNISKEYTVGQQYGANAVYQDIVNLLVHEDSTRLTDEEITMLYHDLQGVTGWSIRYYGVEGYDKQIFNIFGFLADKSTLLVGAPEDDFVETWYTGYEIDSSGNIIREGLEWSVREIMQWSPEEQAKYYPAAPKTVYKEKYFDTMFYKTYFGPASGSPETGLSPTSFQVPCLDMIHFYAEYISDLTEYQYDSGQAAVIIAKYYEGAYVNGNVTFKGEPLDVQIIAQKNLTYAPDYTIPIDHDKTNTNETGSFSVLAGAGSMLQIRRNLGAGSFVITNITFEGDNNSEYAPITDDDAMRRSNSNYERILDIEIEPAEIQGYIYRDVNDDGVYNASIDEPLSDIIVELKEITEFFENNTINFNGRNVTLATDENGSYEVSDLLPGYYKMVVYDNEGYTLHLTDLALYSGNTSYDIAQPKLGNLEGMIYYDSNLNNEYDSGEEMSDVRVDLSFRGTLVDSYNTTADGKYSFNSLQSGWSIGSGEQQINVNEYVIEASQLPTYYFAENVLPVENTTTTHNISIALYPVTANGVTKDNNTLAGVEGITLVFEPDVSISRNTAKLMTNIISTEGGAFTVDLTPGSYNVSGFKEEGAVLVYLSSSKLVIPLRTDELPTTIDDILVDKQSVTVSGITSYNGVNKNATVTFKRDTAVVENNTAVIEAIAISTGPYSIELTPGSYVVSALSNMYAEDGVNYTYSDTLTIDEGYIEDAYPYDIVLQVKEEEVESEPEEP